MINDPNTVVWKYLIDKTNISIINENIREIKHYKSNQYLYSTYVIIEWRSFWTRLLDNYRYDSLLQCNINLIDENVNKDLLDELNNNLCYSINIIDFKYILKFPRMISIYNI